MDWIVFDAMYPLPFGWRYQAGSPPHDSAPTETDLWITAQTYEFVAARSACAKCGADLRRKVDVGIVSDGHGQPETPWLIMVGARCRGWRRHRHTALVAERRGSLRFGELRPS